MRLHCICMLEHFCEASSLLHLSPWATCPSCHISPSTEKWVGAISTIKVYLRASNSSLTQQLQDDRGRLWNPLETLWKPILTVHFLPAAEIGEENERVRRTLWVILESAIFLSEPAILSWPLFKCLGLIQAMNYSEKVKAQFATLLANIIFEWMKVAFSGSFFSLSVHDVLKKSVLLFLFFPGRLVWGIQGGWAIVL